ncbi:MAG: DUF421 domain-containing protein [Clostridia bacterium]|nr:DUF421 domain-containing protein [Clostridia bacterium]
MINTILTTISVYFILIISMRIMGKRQLGELQASEFVIAIMLSEIATTPITNPEYPVTTALLSISALVALEYLISTLLLRSNKLKRIFYGSPAILINQGTMDIRAMKKNRIELDELLCELRLKGFSDISHINYAILEENGKLSVFPKADHAPVTAGDLKLDISDNGIAHLLILDGTVLDHNLPSVNWNRERIACELSKRKVSINDVFLLSVDDGKHVSLILKEKKQDA